MLAKTGLIISTTVFLCGCVTTTYRAKTEQYAPTYEQIARQKVMEQKCPNAQSSVTMLMGLLRMSGEEFSTERYYIPPIPPNPPRGFVGEVERRKGINSIRNEIQEWIDLCDNWVPPNRRPGERL